MMAFDVGVKRIGVAVSKEGVVLPVGTLEAGEKGAHHAASLMKEKGITACVVGLPLTLSYKKKAAAKAVELFCKELQKESTVRIHMHDERFSTKRAEQKLTAAGIKKEKQKELIDAAAAVDLLESFLEKNAHTHNN